MAVTSIWAVHRSIKDALDWLVYSIYHSGVVALAKREIEKAKCRLTSEEFDTLQKFICKDESLPYGQLFD